MLTLDHIAVSGTDLNAAQTHVEGALGVPMQPGGEHDVFFTHNTLLGLADGLYLEAISINPEAPKPDRPRWFDLDGFTGPPRLTNWICRTDDLDAACTAIPFDMGAPVALQRGDLRWRMAVPADGRLPFDNLCPALITWDSPARPHGRLSQRGVRMTALHLSHPEAATLQSGLANVLGDPRIRFHAGPPGLRAEFDTPTGPRQL